MLNADRYRDVVLEEHDDAVRGGIRGVPTIRLGGRLLYGARSQAELVDLLTTSAAA